MFSSSRFRTFPFCNGSLSSIGTPRRRASLKSRFQIIALVRPIPHGRRCKGQPGSTGEDDEPADAWSRSAIRPPDVSRSEGRPLAALALYGIPTLEGFARVHTVQAHTNFSIAALSLVTHLQDTLNFNYANRSAFGHVAYVSSWPTSPSRMIDDDASTFFSFAPNDPHPTIVLALASQQKLHRVTALSGISDARVEVYLLDRLETDPADLSHARLVGSATTNSSDDTLGVDFPSQTAHYVALRWYRNIRTKESRRSQRCPPSEACRSRWSISGNSRIFLRMQPSPAKAVRISAIASARWPFRRR